MIGCTFIIPEVVKEIGLLENQEKIGALPLPPQNVNSRVNIAVCAPIWSGNDSIKREAACMNQLSGEYLSPTCL